MAHFVELNEENIVLRVVRVANEDTMDINGVENEQIGINFCQQLFGGGVWKQTSYNTKYNAHQLGGTPLRKNFAGIGYTYDQYRDAYIPPKTIQSFVLNEDTCNWEPPYPPPDDNDKYYWVEPDGWVLDTSD